MTPERIAEIVALLKSPEWEHFMGYGDSGSFHGDHRDVDSIVVNALIWELLAVIDPSVGLDEPD